MPTLDELGQKVKAKYPGVYDDMPDADVAQKVQAKFPGKYDDFSEPSQADFADVTGGSSVQGPPGLGQQLKQSFVDAGRNIKKYAWDAPLDVLDRPVRPIREAIQADTTGLAEPAYGMARNFVPDNTARQVAKAVSTPKEILKGAASQVPMMPEQGADTVGGVGAEVVKQGVGGLASGENIAMLAALPVLPAWASAAVLAKFSASGAVDSYNNAKHLIANWSKMTPEERQQGLGGLLTSGTMALAPVVHVAAKPVNEAVSRFMEPAARLDFGDVRPEDMAPPKNTVSRFNLAESDKAFRLARDKQAAVDALEKFKNELPEPPEPKVEPPPVEPVGRPGFAEDQGFDPRVVRDFTDWADQNRPAFDDLPKQPPKPWAAGEEGPTARTAIADGDKFDVSPERPLAGPTATGSLGEAARPVVERAAEAETRPVESTAPRAAEAGEGVAPVEGGLPLEQPDLTQRSTGDMRRAAGVPEYEGSRFSRSNQGLRDAVAGNEEALVARGLKAKPGEILSPEVQYALKQHGDRLAREGGDPAEVLRIAQILDESASGKGRELQALQTAIENVDHTDPAAVTNLAIKATKGKLSIQAMRDLRDMSVKAGKMKELSAEAINKRAEAALARLEGMGEHIRQLKVKDVLGCP